ncbi:MULTISPECIES: GNAT family N-acetyltransferase [Novosphingobium]|uniref:N-acetyltransferase family protein n=1 Tax=Novosphingobium mangrovi (ex Hu et al. 2023) TaxID=2930094 RepID=A0ABT0AC63_9SPHN|nr:MULTISPECIES: GNAT family N-acetyltransferase [Novosphingobium]MCJ1960790.1 N-acetyltransferase family protein [Novosphingobium mangrovi (ex Hu et al. 2023)]GAM05378.1 phosphinothricin acetyltransferase [Novosphingobium sp. MBES04]
MTNDELTVEEASAKDAQSITEIFSHYVLKSTATFETEPPGCDAVRQRIADLTQSGYPYLVSRDANGKVLGFGYAQRYGPRVGYRYSVETTVYVRADCVRRGIGSALIKALIDECEARGFRQAFAVIASSEPASVILHARAGYRPVGTLEGAGWKHEQWIDVFLMQRKLGEGNDTLPEPLIPRS